MIEGLHFDFPAHEIKAHLVALADHHAKRADAYRESLAKIGAEANAEDIGVSNSGRQDIKTRIDAHTKKAKEFKILADHIVDGEVYRLNASWKCIPGTDPGASLGPMR